MNLKLIAATLTGLGLSACATPTPDLTRPHQQAAFATQRPQLNTVNIIDGALQSTLERSNGTTHVSTKLAVEGSGSAPTATGGREVWVSLRNLTDYPQNVETRVTWYDAAERPVDGPSAWDRLFLTANGGETFRSFAVNPSAVSFYVEIRELN